MDSQEPQLLRQVKRYVLIERIEESSCYKVVNKDKPGKVYCAKVHSREALDENLKAMREFKR